MSITLRPDAETEGMLSELAERLGSDRETAAIYAIRLVAACYREGLLTDSPSAAWPEEARHEPLEETGTGGKVLEFPQGRFDRAKR